jgi:hypothetical protein
MQKLGPSLVQLMKERLQNDERRREKEVVSNEVTRRVEPGVPHTPETKEGQVAATEWQTIERRDGKK